MSDQSKYDAVFNYKSAITDEDTLELNGILRENYAGLIKTLKVSLNALSL